MKNIINDIGNISDTCSKRSINVDRLYNFLEQNITSKYKNKLLILNNTSFYRHEKIKELINRNNKVLYSMSYQYFTNSIEDYFSLLKKHPRQKIIKHNF